VAETPEAFRHAWLVAEGLGRTRRPAEGVRPPKERLFILQAPGVALAPLQRPWPQEPARRLLPVAALALAHGLAAPIGNTIGMVSAFSLEARLPQNTEAEPALRAAGPAGLG